MAQTILSNLDFGSVAKIVNLPNASAAQEPVTLAQLQSAIEGLSWKDNVVVAASTNVVVATPGTAIDGITLNVNDRVLLMAQTAGAENGIYIFNGSAVAMTRALDANSAAELTNATVVVDQGTAAGVAYRQTVANPTVGTTALVFTQFGTIAPASTTTTAGVIRLATQAEVDAGSLSTVAVSPSTLASYANKAKRYSATVGDGTATSYTVTHNLNTQDVNITVRRSASPYDEVLCDVAATTVNTATVGFASAPASGAYRVTILA